jgi:hypothetical protein
MGYMKMVRGELIEEYGWLPHFDSIYQARMSNTHPGPLPETVDTYGSTLLSALKHLVCRPLGTLYI